MSGLDHKIRLKSLEVEGFRGVNKRVHLDFGPKATVLSAWNGRGKSTLLGAIEWGLFGELKFQPPENRTRDEMVSVFHPGGRAFMQLTLSDNCREVRVRRTRTLGKMGSDLEVTDGTGATLEDEDASDFLFRFTGLGFDDFYRAAFLHQDSIRGLLTEEQKDRDEALDRLLGVETIRNILTSIPLKPVVTALDDIETQEAKIMERLSGAGDMAETTRARALSEAVEAGYSEESLSLKQGASESAALIAALRKACTKYEGESPEDVPVESPDDLERVARRVKATTREIRLAVGKETPLDAALGRLGELKKIAGEIRAAQGEEQTAKAELGAHDESFKTPDVWAKTKSTMSAAVARGEAALHLIDAHRKVVADAIAYLEAVPDAKECPVCGEPKVATQLVTRLSTLVKRDQAAEIKRLRSEIEAASDKLSELEGLEKARGKLATSFDGCKQALELILANSRNTLGMEGANGDPLLEIATQEKAINDRLQGLRNLNKERVNDLDQLDQGADRLRALQRFLKAEMDFRRVREQSDVGEQGGAKAFDEQKSQLIALKTDLGSIILALSGLATGRAEDALGRCGPDISRVYGELCNHPYFDGLKIEVGQKAVSGVQRNTYRIIAYSTKDGQRTAASSRLSTAQMNCVALSAYLSLSRVLTHNLGFILLDDPSQNLDSEHKKALAAVLKALLPSVQLVVGTHDAEFDGFLRSGLGKDGVSWYDLHWAPREGTSLKA